MPALNLVFRLLLQLTALGGAAVVGWQAGSGALRWILAIVGPAVFAGVWGRFIAPKAGKRLADPGRLLVEVVLFAAVATGLATVGSPVLGSVLFVAVATNLALMVALGQRGL